MFSARGKSSRGGGAPVADGVWLSQGEPSQVKRTLCQKIEFWQQSPAFLLVIQEDPVFAGYLPERHRGSRIVLPTSHTLAIE